jgi:hypothetical protein
MMAKFLILSEQATSMSHKMVDVLVLHEGLVKEARVRLAIDSVLAVDESSLIAYWRAGEVASEERQLYFVAKQDQGRPINANAAATMPQLREIVQELAERVIALEKLLLR